MRCFDALVRLLLDTLTIDELTRLLFSVDPTLLHDWHHHGTPAQAVFDAVGLLRRHGLLTRFLDVLHVARPHVAVRLATFRRCCLRVAPGPRTPSPADPRRSEAILLATPAVTDLRALVDLLAATLLRGRYPASAYGERWVLVHPHDDRCDGGEVLAPWPWFADEPRPWHAWPPQPLADFSVGLGSSVEVRECRRDDLIGVVSYDHALHRGLVGRGIRRPARRRVDYHRWIPRGDARDPAYVHRSVLVAPGVKRPRDHIFAQVRLR